MIPVPYGMGYHSTLQSSVPRHVKCEACQLEYVYMMTRRASGEGTSLLFLDNVGAKIRAEDAAWKKLQHALANDCDPVPCPGCGQYQQHMIPKLVTIHFGWMEKASLALCLIAVIAVVPALFARTMAQQDETSSAIYYAIGLWSVFGLCMFGAVALPILKFLAIRGYDPNNEHLQERIELGRKLAITRAQFEELQKIAEEEKAKAAKGA